MLPQSQPLLGCYNPVAGYLPTVAAAYAELTNPTSRKMQHAVDGAFKIPGLRDVELTGPYMHSGMATLAQVMKFYPRGGNFDAPSKQVGFVFAQTDFRFSPQKRAKIIEYLRALTDDRVRCERAPFDHPSLVIPHGHAGNQHAVNPRNPLGANLAQERLFTVPAVWVRRAGPSRFPRSSRRWHPKLDFGAPEE